MVLTLLNYQPPRYRGRQNNPDDIIQQIIGWQRVWRFFLGYREVSFLKICGAASFKSILIIPAVSTSAFHSTEWKLYFNYIQFYSCFLVTMCCSSKRQLLNFLRWPINVIHSVENTKLPFSIFLLVPGKIYLVVSQLEIFRLLSRSGTLREK